MDAIKFDDVRIKYRIKFVEDHTTIWEDFWALKGISFTVAQGESLGIVGANGAGKSSILKVIAGILTPDGGSVSVSGKVAGLLELGTGIQRELTGRENIYLTASLFGLSNRQISEMFHEIENFASLGKFINAPVKCYSQGMMVRLAFAVAVYADPAIFLIDDTLAVGDESFQRKCIKRLIELDEQGKTIVYVAHDMHMLSRLCNRIILIKDGTIMRDDTKDKVIPFYSQMVGTQRGVGSLENGPLCLICNNGRLFLNWGNFLVTPHPGIHAVCSIDYRWYSLQGIEWHVTQQDQNAITMVGQFYQLDLRQEWQVRINHDQGIELRIVLAGADTIKIQEFYLNVMVSHEYSHWFTPLETGIFPKIEFTDKDWQEVLSDDISRNCVGVFTCQDSHISLPPVSLVSSFRLSKSSMKLVNTGYLSHMRVLQYKTAGVEVYGAMQAHWVEVFAGNIDINMSDIDKYRRHLYEEYILFNDIIKLLMDNGRCVFLFNDIPLTKSDHFASSFKANGQWYLSTHAQWEIKRPANNILVARGIWNGLPLEQLWKIEITGKESFQITMAINIVDELDIPEQNVKINFSEKYSFYATTYGSGVFPEQFSRSQIDMLQRCLPPGITLLESIDDTFPSISINNKSHPSVFSKLFNSDQRNRSRIIYIQRVEAEEQSVFPPGEYDCFKIEVSLANKRVLKNVGNCAIIEREKLRLLFGQGKGRVFWEGKEFTKRLGIYSSIRSRRRWYDSSSSAAWQITNQTDQKIEVEGKWYELPLCQIWNIYVKKDGRIELAITMNVDEEFIVDRLQANVMVSEKYSEWFAANEKGFFPSFRIGVDDDWDTIWAPEQDNERDNLIGVSGISKGNQHLPMVKLSGYSSSFLWKPALINTDCYHRGRVLQYANNEQQSLLPGEYHFFQGEIIIAGI